MLNLSLVMMIFLPWDLCLYFDYEGYLVTDINFGFQRAVLTKLLLILKCVLYPHSILFAPDNLA